MSPHSFIEQTKKVDFIIKKGKWTKELALLLKDENILNYFYKRISSIKWFYPLKHMFNFKYNPSPIESEKEKGFFTIPYWPALIYLEKVSKECSKPKNIEYAKALMDVIRNVARSGGDKNKRVDNWRTWQSFVKIMANLPQNIVQLSDIDLVSGWLDNKFDISIVVMEIGKTLLPKLLETKGDNLKKVSRIVGIIIDSFKVEGRHSLETYTLQEIFKINAVRLGQKCGKEVATILKKKIEIVVVEKDDAYCYIWRSTIEEHEQNVGADKYRDILIAGLRDVLLSYASKQHASEIIKEFFKSKKYIVKRICLYILDKLFEKPEYKKLANKIIQKHVTELFLERNYNHEWYLFLKNHFKEFSGSLQKTLLDTVEALEGKWRDDADKENLNTRIRRKWFGAIKSAGYKLSAELKEKYFKGIDDKFEHPEFLSYTGPVSRKEENLFSSTDLLAQGSIANIISFLNSYHGKNRFGESAVREAGLSLKEAVKVKQEFFENALLEFIKAKREYWCYLIQAFEELLEDKKEISWGKVLEFCLLVVKQEILWTGEKPDSHFSPKPRKSWVTDAIADLIKKSVKNDGLILPDNCLQLMDKIIRIMLNKQESTVSEKDKDKDALAEVINTPKGHVLECFKSYILRRYRIYEKLPDKGIKEKKSFWKKVEPLFDREIEKMKERNFEFSSIAGSYLPNLYYLNKNWVEKNISNIFPKDEDHWRYAIQGYSYVTTVYSAIYSLLKDSGNLKRALDTKFDSGQPKRRIIENIAVSFIRGQETLSGKSSLFKYILERWQEEDIGEIINLFWAHRNAELSCEQKGRIFDFWRYCFNRIKGHEEKNKNILSDLNLLAVFLDGINSEQKAWLTQSAPCVGERYHSPFFIEYLDKLANVKPKETGEIFLAVLDKTMPSYKEENMRSIVEKIYKAKYKDIANLICDKYARAGFEFLTDIYKKYNQ